MNNEEILFSLLSMEICGGTVSGEVKAALSEEMLGEVYALAKKHDLAHIVGNALSKLGVLGDNEISQKFKKAAMQAVYRYVKLNGEYQKICKTLEDAQIPFIPLKGSVLRNYYPEPWMRTSCDIDILVKGQDLDAAAAAVVEKNGYTNKGKGDHDISMFSTNGVHLELHYNAIDEGRFPEAQAILGNIWNDAIPKADSRYYGVMSDGMFYFYHLAHMAKHIENGGCGIRPLLDLWILNHRIEYDRAARERLLIQGGMLQFAQAAEKLSEVWFAGAEKDTLSSQMERFILDGGVYGTLENNVAVNQSKKGGKLQYALSKIFLPYDTLKFYYPVLQKHRWLTPFFEVRRWIKLIFTSEAKRSLQTLKTNAEISAEEISSTAELLKQLGL